MSWGHITGYALVALPCPLYRCGLVLTPPLPTPMFRRDRNLLKVELEVAIKQTVMRARLRTIQKRRKLDTTLAPCMTCRRRRRGRAPKGGALFEFQTPTPPPPRPPPSRPPKVFTPGWGLEFEQAAPLAGP